MDRNWVRGRLFSPEHIEGVKQFMSFVEEKFSENAEILCPCGRCLNQKYYAQSLVLFKGTHYSKKKEGYMLAVQSAITEMENQLATPREGEEQPNSATQAVGNVLEQRTKKNCFLRNVGIKIARARSNVQNVEAELQVEKRVNAELRDQVDALTRQMQETEQARIRDQEENKKRQSEMEAKLGFLLARSQPS
ncbi:unnamed protein product [Urochloa decumbens]|uniref:Transposase-associated domain-containing protein n=1 Tax=Urochloa decumbens TaxID=240449 RepID=A0ABC8VC43_9POAL